MIVATGVYDLYLPTQGMADVRGGFATVAGIEREKLRIHAWDVGGGFGVRNEVYPEFSALLLATRLLGRPVKWVGSRAESILSDHHGRGAKLTGALALDKDGNFLGRPHRVVGGHGGLWLQRWAVHQHRGGADLDRGQCLQDSGRLRIASARFHQHDTDHRLPGRRPAERRVSRGAPGG